MPKHLCIDPHDPYAQHEVMVEFERIGSGFRLVAVIDDLDDDILPDLVEAQRDDLRRELADADRNVSDLILLRMNHHAGSLIGTRDVPGPSRRPRTGPHACTGSRPREGMPLYLAGFLLAVAGVEQVGQRLLT